MYSISNQKTRYIVRIGVFSALAFIIMLLEFYIGFAEYLKLDFSDVIAMIGGITMGPLAAAAIQLVKNLLKALIITRTAGIGELANLIVGIAFVVPASIVYHKFKSNKGLFLGLIVGSISMVVFACIANLFIILPLYFGSSLTFEMRWNTVLAVFIPFNIIKGIVVSLVTYLLHLAMKPIYKHFM
jgi:riboflavin transporter FmnP